MLSELRPAMVLLFAFSVLTGILYPAAVTGIAQAALSRPASGMMVEQDGVVVGSELVGQPFADPGRFWSRSSATAPFPYNAAASSGSNQGPTNPALIAEVTDRVKALRDADPGNTAPVPVDLVTASGSGLDPHISLAAAYFQVGRVARVRGVSPEEVRRLIDERARRPLLGVLGAPHVDVLALNLALDRLAPAAAAGM